MRMSQTRLQPSVVSVVVKLNALPVAGEGTVVPHDALANLQADVGIVWPRKRHAKMLAGHAVKLSAWRQRRAVIVNHRIAFQDETMLIAWCVPLRRPEA